MDGEGHGQEGNHRRCHDDGLRRPGGIAGGCGGVHILTLQLAHDRRRDPRAVAGQERVGEAQQRSAQRCVRDGVAHNRGIRAVQNQ